VRTIHVWCALCGHYWVVTCYHHEGFCRDTKSSVRTIQDEGHLAAIAKLERAKKGATK